MKIIDSLLVKNPCYKAGKKITVKGLMLHSVGCPQPSAKVFVDSWNTKSQTKAIHGFIDAITGDVYQTLPWNHRAYHCGGSANNTHIGVEMCEPKYIKYTTGSSFTCSNKDEAVKCAKKVYESAVKLFAKLCKEYKLDPMKKGVIISHREGYDLGIASNHGDPEHLWKGLGLKYTMDSFRSDVKKELDGNKDTANKVNVTESNKNTSNIKASNYRVKVTANKLNVRSGAGTSYKVVTTVKKNDVYTIVGEVDTKEGVWGKLKSGVGFILLSYTKRV